MNTHRFTRLCARHARAVVTGLAAGLVLTAVTPAAAQEYTPVKRLGTSQALCKPAISTAADLQNFFANDRDAVLQVLADAGWQGNPDDLFSAVANGNFSEASIPVGTRLEWMGLKKKGKVVGAVPNRVWAGKAPFDAFVMSVASSCQMHEIVIPKACCNVSLVRSTPITTPPPTINVQQSGECGPKSVTVDIAAADDATVELTITGPDGATQTVTPTKVDNGYRWESVLNDPGSYTIAATASSQCGASEPATEHVDVDQCAAVVPAERRVWPLLAAFVGHESRQREVCNVVSQHNANLVGATGGVIIPVATRTGILLQGGGGWNLDEHKDSTVFADIGAEQLIGEKGFIGGGVGIWDINDSKTRDGSLFVHGGVDTPWKLGTGTVQWFLEGRTFFDEFGDDYAALTGLRVLWK